MKIDNSAKSLASVAGTAAQRSTGARPANLAPRAESAESALTALSAAGLQAAGSDAAFDAGKVAEIRQAISEGRFKIDAGRIADGLVASVKEMLTQQNGRSR